MRQAVLDCGLAKPATPHTLRHWFGTHLLDVRATMIYIDLLNRGGRGVSSPLDTLLKGTAPGNDP